MEIFFRGTALQNLSSSTHRKKNYHMMHFKIQIFPALFHILNYMLNSTKMMQVKHYSLRVLTFQQTTDAILLFSQGLVWKMVNIVILH